MSACADTGLHRVVRIDVAMAEQDWPVRRTAPR